MKQKVLTSLNTILIVFGIILSILNLVTNAYSEQYIWGTVERVTGILHQDYLARLGRHLYGEYYCVGEPSTCCIVFAN
jgi:TM2 domain-containing membrane protein YozV